MMMKIYKIKKGETNIIFFKVNFLGNVPLIDFDGDVIHEPYLSFGTRKYTGMMSSNPRPSTFDGSIKCWNLSYAHLGLLKERNILIKDCKYGISTFQKLYDLFVDHNVPSSESTKIIRFYESLSTKYDNIKQGSDILIFKSTNKVFHDTLNVFFKDNFTQIHTNRENTYDNIGIDFSPKDLKIKR